MDASSSTSTALVPAKTAPVGQVSNFVDPETIEPAVIAGLTVCLTLATLSVFVRLYAQWSLYKKFLWADFCTVFGWASQVAFVGLLFACLPYGGGRHIWDVTKPNFKQINFFLFIDYIIYGCAITGPKISILLQLIAVFVPRGRDLSRASRAFYWFAVFLIAANLLFYVPHNFVLIFQCHPIAKGWDSSIHGTCLDQFVLIQSSGPFNIASDFLIFLLPLSVIWRLQLPLKTRLGIISAFAIGLFGCICSGVRFYYSDKLTQTGDTTYLVFQNQLWANAEITTAIIISNIIILPRFIRFKRGLLSSAPRYGSQYAQQSNGAPRSNARASRHRSAAFSRNSKYATPSSDPYMEIDGDSTVQNSRTESQVKEEEYELEQGPGGERNQGILRTIQIDTTEETLPIPSPARVAFAPDKHSPPSTVTNQVGSHPNHLSEPSDDDEEAGMGVAL